MFQISYKNMLPARPLPRLVQRFVAFRLPETILTVGFRDAGNAGQSDGGGGVQPHLEGQALDARRRHTEPEQHAPHSADGDAGQRSRQHPGNDSLAHQPARSRSSDVAQGANVSDCQNPVCTAIPIEIAASWSNAAESDLVCLVQHRYQCVGCMKGPEILDTADVLLSRVRLLDT